MAAAIVASVIFALTLVLIFTETLNRVIAAIAGAVLMVLAGLVLGFYEKNQILAAVDFNTLGLLLGMMILVAMLEPTGVFEYLAVRAGKLSRGSPVRLLILLGSVTTILSMFLDNVTTVVLIAPVTILICEILGLAPTAFLMTEALLSNTGGVATLVGDPPNILIGSSANLSFTDFLTHALPVVFLAWSAALLLLRYLFRRDLSVRSQDADAILRLDPRKTLKDARTARRVLIILGVAIGFFFINHYLGIETSLVALSASAVALTWIRPNIDDLFKRIEWSVLIFFLALFVMVGGLNAAGVFELLTGSIQSATSISPQLLGVLVIWLVAIISALVDNIPVTIALIPIIQGLGQAGVNITPLWWALAFGAGFGGNGTILGSSANIIVATLSERTRTPITSKLWNRRGLPVMLVTCTVASLLYALAFPLFLR